jgi:hypothetical protein
LALASHQTLTRSRSALLALQAEYGLSVGCHRCRPAVSLSLCGVRAWPLPLEHFLLIAAIFLPLGPASDYLGNAMPYQDPTEEMLQQQAARATALEHQLAIRGGIAAVLAILGSVALVYFGRQRHRSRPGGEGVQRDGQPDPTRAPPTRPTRQRRRRGG